MLKEELQQSHTWTYVHLSDCENCLYNVWCPSRGVKGESNVVNVIRTLTSLSSIRASGFDDVVSQGYSL